MQSHITDQEGVRCSVEESWVDRSERERIEKQKPGSWIDEFSSRASGRSVPEAFSYYNHGEAVEEPNPDVQSGINFRR